MTSRAKSSEFEVQLKLVGQAIEPATIKLKIAWTWLVADEDELNVVFRHPLAKAFNTALGAEIEVITRAALSSIKICFQVGFLKGLQLAMTPQAIQSPKVAERVF